MSTSNQALAQAVEKARASWLDGTTENLIFRHKQLYALFNLLKTHSDSILSILTSERHALELEHCLSEISRIIESKFPKNLRRSILQRLGLKDALPKGQGEGSIQESAGVVVIVANQSHPIASWTVPLAAAIADGNPAVVVLPVPLETVFQSVQSSFRRALVQDAYPMLFADIETVPQELLVAKVTSLASLHHRSVPVIVDQSVLPGGIPLHPVSGHGQPTPENVKVVAANIARAYHLGSRGDNVNSNSVALPTYIAVHENVSGLLQRELKELNVPFVKQDVANKASLKTLQSTVPGYLDHIPLYEMTSMDYAIDWIQDDMGPTSFAYVYASEQFGKYAARSLKKVQHVIVNQVGEKALACGPYQHLEDFGVTTHRRISLKTQPTVPTNSLNSVTAISQCKARAVKQVPGSRIDFFGGSFLLAAGVFVSSVLGFAGWGVVKGGIWLTHHLLR